MTDDGWKPIIGSSPVREISQILNTNQADKKNLNTDEISKPTSAPILPPQSPPPKPTKINLKPTLNNNNNVPHKYGEYKD